MDGLKISEVAARAGVNVSTVRYYERAGLVPDPERSAGGYRLYGAEHESRLLFITRARRLGLSLEQIAEMLGVWTGTNCETTRARLVQILDANLAELQTRILELTSFAAELSTTRQDLTGGPAECTPDLDCCAPTVLPATGLTLRSN
jgi:DNA-binding transcriptional MerR regulator